jgi:hypothetical protein
VSILYVQCWEKQSGCATLLFAQADQARRFKTRYTNHSIGERALNITYPHNNSNHYHHHNSSSSNNWRRGKSPYRSQQSYYHSRARTRSPSGGRFQQREAVLCQQQRSVSHESNCRIVDIEAKKSEAVAVSLEEEDSAVILAEKIAQDLSLRESEPTQANSVVCQADNAQLTRLQPCPVTFIPYPLPALLTAPEQQQEQEENDATSSLLRDCNTTTTPSVTPHLSNKQSLLGTSDSFVVVGNGETNSEENDDILPLVSPVLSPPPSPKFRPIVLLLYVLDCDREPDLVSRRVSEELLSLNRRTLLSGGAPSVLSAAALYRDVAVRIGCANHDDAGLLLDNLQTRLHYLTLDARTGVKKYFVRSEFLSNDDEYIYRIGRTIRRLLQEEASPGTSLQRDYFFNKFVDFIALRKRFAKNYGGECLQISDVQQLGYFVVEDSTAETFRVRLMTETRRNYIFR